MDQPNRPRPRTRTSKLLLARCSLLLTLTALLPCGAAALELTVNDTRDWVDGNVGDGVCSVEQPPPASPTCTLRAAIQEVNASETVRHYIDLPAGEFELTNTGSGEDAAQTGDLDLTWTVEIDGAGADLTIIDGYGFDRVFDVIDGQLQLRDLTIRDGRAPNGEDGGAIRHRDGYVSTATRVRFLSNRAPGGEGGAIHANDGPWRLTDVEIAGNTASARGGGLWLSWGNHKLERVSVHSNTAGSYGGGLYFAGIPAEIENSTFSGNTAGLGGGGIYAAGSSAFTLLGLTVVGNTTTNGDGGGIEIESGDVSFVHSVFANNEAPNGSGADCYGELSRAYGTLIGEAAGCVYPAESESMLTGLNPRLGALALNSAFAPNHLPLLESPLIDASRAEECEIPLGEGAVWGGLEEDQRAYERPAGGAQGICDMGSVEVQPGDELHAVDCMALGQIWGPISRGFYVEDFAGHTLGEVTLPIRAETTGWYRIVLRAQEGSYAGNLLGQVMTEQIWLPRQDPLVFDFQGIAVPKGGTIAFVPIAAQVPSGAGEVTYNEGSCPNASGEACAACPGVFQTEHNSGDLGAIRQGGVAVTIAVPEPAMGILCATALSVLAARAGARRRRV